MESPEHLDALREAMVAFVRSAQRAGLRAPVPTTPEWSVRRLVAHLGATHRWATALIEGHSARPEQWEQEGIDAADPLDWLRDGAIDLVTSLVGAPDDVIAPVFLADGGEPKPFWIRRQCHETTMHAVDALAAALGRRPTAYEAPWITEAVALDGIDELLTGFLPRPVSRLHSEEPQSVLVAPEGSALRWLVEVGRTMPVVHRVTGEPEADVRLRGGAVALYLALWNRSDEIRPEGDLGDHWDAWAVT